MNQKNDDEDDPENNTEPNRTGVNDFGKLTVLEFAKLVMLVATPLATLRTVAVVTINNRPILVHPLPHQAL